MDGRAFLEVARELALGATEAHWRASAGRAYYALMLEVRDRLERWGFPRSSRDRVHHQTRLRLVFSMDTDLKQIGFVLEELGKLRSRADYEMTPLREFTSSARVRLAVQNAENAIALLDQIDADPARRASAIASIQP